MVAAAKGAARRDPAAAQVDKQRGLAVAVRRAEATTAAVRASLAATHAMERSDAQLRSRRVPAVQHVAAGF